MGRRWAREKTFQLLYQIEMRDDAVDEQIESFIEHLKYFNEDALGTESEMRFAVEDLQFIRSLVSGVEAEKDVLDEAIKPYLKAWTLDRLPRVDRSLLRLGAYEIMHLPDVPKSVSINEIVVLAKAYAAEEAHAYINAVLANFEKQSSEEDVAKQAFLPRSEA